MYDFSNFPAVCRICLKPSLDFHISQQAAHSTESFQDLLQQFVPTENVSDELPTHLCSDCVRNLVDWLHWKQQTKLVLRFSIALATSKRSNDSKPIKELLDIENDSLRQCLFQLQIVDRVDFLVEDLLSQIHGITDDQSELCIEQVELDNLQDEDGIEMDLPVEEPTSKVSVSSKIIRRNGIRYKVCILAGCNEEYEMGNRAAYLQHDKIYHRYGCNLCGRVLASRTSFRNHVRLHDGEDAKVKCEFCERKFTTKGGMSVHVREVHNTSEVHFNCQYCDEGFMEQRDLFTHLQEHRECKSCKETFPDLPGWINHNKKKHAESLQSCTQCNYLSLSRTLLDRHIRMKHSKIGEDAKDQRFTAYAINNTSFHQCPQCSFQFITEDQLLQHNEQTHNQPHTQPPKQPTIQRRSKQEREQFSFRYSCDVCGKKYRFKNSLWSHTHKEHNSASHQTATVCDICGQHFKHRSSLMVHIASKHATERPFRCKQCPRAFSRSYLLKEHLKSHDAEKKYPCSRCDYRAKQSYALKEHIIRIHGGDIDHGMSDATKVEMKVTGSRSSE